VSHKIADPGEVPGSRSVRTRERILDATAAVLCHKGFAGTRLSDIAERARVEMPAIHYYYPSREDLIEEVVFLGAVAMRSHVAGALDALQSGATPSIRIAVAVQAHLRHELELSDYAKAVVRNANQLPEHVGRRACAEIGAYHDVWRGLVGELAAAGELRDGLDPAAAYMLVVGALNSTVDWWDPASGPIEDLIRTTLSMVLHALRT
jgi:AcrR family transcriptional regulator